MKRVLVTGGTGFVGRNSMPLLQEKFEIVAPRRSDVNLLDPAEFRRFAENQGFDVLLHLANPNPAKNDLDSSDRMFEDSMRAFSSVYSCADLCEKIIYLGSGAEMDKRLDMHLIKEDSFGRSFPVDAYGKAKYLQNQIARRDDSVVNLRLFACYGPWDHWSKFITHCIRSVIAGKPITIRQDCIFDYLHVYDLARVLCWAIDGHQEHSDYNVSTGKEISLSEIAAMVLDEMGSNLNVDIKDDGWNKSYSASNERLSNEMGVVDTIDIRQGIKMQIAHETDVYPIGGYEQL